MALTRQELRNYVREYYDLDITEMPDSLVDIWLNDGFRRAKRATPRWTFYEFVGSFTTISGVAAYTLSGVDLTLLSVDRVVGENFDLDWLDATTAESQWLPESETAGKPFRFSIWGNAIRLWPKPDAAYDIFVRGYKQAKWAADAGAIPDIPEEFHELIGTWAVSRAAAQQDDPAGGQFHREAFYEGLAELKRQYVNAGPGPVILNSERRTSGFYGTGLPDRIRYPWES